MESHLSRSDEVLVIVKISKEYIVEQGIVVLTVECPPLPTTKHTIIASALADGSVDLINEMQRLTDEANTKLAQHQAVLNLMGEE